jgi:hypothetical protein
MSQELKTMTVALEQANHAGYEEGVGEGISQGVLWGVGISALIAVGYGLWEYRAQMAYYKARRANPIPTSSPTALEFPTINEGMMAV